MIVFKILWRLIMVAVGSLIASIAAACFLLVALEITDPAYLLDRPDGLYLIETIIVALLALGAVLIGTFSSSLVALAVLIAEIFAIRSWIYYTAAGMVATYPVARGPEEGLLSIELASANIPIIAAGAVAGLVYFLITGRRAGLALERPRTEETELG